MRTRCEAGFTLVEVVIVAGIVALIAGAAGTFFLAGATPAVASANRDVIAAFDEGRRTAIAFDSATVVFVPALSGSGYRARAYARVPGDDAFAPRNGPSYESTVALTETAAPMGAPGFAFTIDSHGAVAGLAHYSPGRSDYVATACPASGAFTLHLAYVHDVRDVAIPCRLDASATSPLVLQTPSPAVTMTPSAAQTCPSTEQCLLAGLPPVGAPTCPPMTSGTFPTCVVVEPTQPPSTPSPGGGTASPNPVQTTPVPVQTPGLPGGQTSSLASGICTDDGAAANAVQYDCTITGGDSPELFTLTQRQAVGIDATGSLEDHAGVSLYVVGSVEYVFQLWRVGQSGFIVNASSVTDPSYSPGAPWEFTERLDLQPGTYAYSMGATCDTGYLNTDVHWCGAPLGAGARPVLAPYSGMWSAIYEFR